MGSIFVSAHLDDAVLSCGGLIYEQTKIGREVEVWTYFCGIPKDKPGDNYARRLEEDCKAVTFLGAKYFHGCFPDAFERGYSEVVSPMKEEDEDLIVSIAANIMACFQAGDKLYCPLGIGGHVDHLVLRRACEQTGIPLTYYMDFPYIDYVPEKINDVISGLSKHAQTISPEGLKYWIKAVGKYSSQQFYETPEITRQKITEYWAKINGIFLWQKLSTEQIFSRIYYENLWKDQKTSSGGGSDLEHTEVIRKALPEVIKKYDMKSILDIPCGDFFWMRLVDLGIDYTGVDIVADLVRQNEIHYGCHSRRRFVLGDIIHGRIPTATVLFCRDCLGHLSNEDVFSALENIKKSSCTYLFTTTFPKASGGWDIQTGKWRPINLQVSPYNFPEPLELIEETQTDYGPKCMGLWKIKDLP